MKRVAYLLPGSGEKGSDKKYAAVRAVLKRRGFVVKHPRVRWYRRSLKSYSEAVVHELRKEKMPPLLVGFSFGAVAALLSATKVPLSRAICCSLSPVFSEDNREFLAVVFKENPSLTHKQFERVWGKRTLAFCKTLHWKAVGAQVLAPVHFLIGSEELALMKARARALAKLVGTRYVEVQGAGHEIEHPNYAKALDAVLRKF